MSDIPQGQALLDAIVAQRQEVERKLEEAEAEKTKLHALVAATQDDPDKSVSVPAAARAMRLHTNRAYQMVKAHKKANS